MELTLEQKIGQLMMIGWQTDQAKDIVDLIKKYHFGNIILFTRNIKNAKQLKDLTAKIQAACIKYNGVPAFIAADQEG
ncbi:MAG: glycoside hydrolase family 3 N-terminal domain-containing protein, partial [Bacilli bacterium]|nr:glycoside hydrolase family 3 N-terminal domain-containing protein [Bacilli bacterium]